MQYTGKAGPTHKHVSKYEGLSETRPRLLSVEKNSVRTGNETTNFVFAGILALFITTDNPISNDLNQIRQ
jgi:hypothetical protein